MSLIKQLWIAIIVMSTLALGSSFFISVYQTRLHLIEHLYLKNADNAAVLAMTLSQAEKDATTIELMLAAQFDTGYYQRITLRSPGGKALFNFEIPAESSIVPTWFVNIVSLDVEPGAALVQDGWEQYATLEIESQYEFSLVALWNISQKLTFMFLLLAVVFGVAGQFFLRGVRKPLNQVVKHAEALGERRFIVSDEPKTLELKNVVKSMNKLSGRVRSILEQERHELDQLYIKYQTDAVTSALNRPYCISWLASHFAHRDKAGAITAFMLRIIDLNKVNLTLGRINTDAWLQKTVIALKQFDGVKLLSRLNGSDFLLLLEDDQDLALQGASLLRIINEVALNCHSDLPEHSVLVGTELKDIDSTSKLFSVLDNLLASAQAIYGRQLLVNTAEQRTSKLNDGSDWLARIKTALATSSFEAEFYPVQLTNGALLHQEAMMRLTVDGQVLRASDVLGWAKRYQLLADIDQAVLQYCITQLFSRPNLTIAVNLSDTSLSDIAVHYKLIAFLQQQPEDVLCRLAIEFDERQVIKQQMQFIQFVLALKKFKISVGIQRCTVAFTALPELEQLGLDYIKIDSAIINAITHDEGRAMINKILKLSHALGLQVIAEGVQDIAQVELLAAAGFDGFTGIAIV